MESFFKKNLMRGYNLKARLSRRFRMLPILLSQVCFPPPRNAARGVTITRFENNPVLTPESSERLGSNINGPSVIRVPPWIKKPLGKYYLYFAHHKGDYIRLAYADAIAGPWRIYNPGTLQLSQVPHFQGHIASPDVHVDEGNEEIRLYFHGVTRGDKQKTGVAFSKDGINFTASNRILGSFYFRVLKWKNHFYAIAKNGAISGELLRSKDGITSFKKISNLILNMRHAAVLLRGDFLVVFYTRMGDAPERIFMSTLKLTNGLKSRFLSQPIEVLRPELDYEGINYPVSPSRFGPAVEVCQLRDPSVFEEKGKTYLFYSVAGEMGIAAAEMKINLP
jgi:hypothetical protein